MEWFEAPGILQLITENVGHLVNHAHHSWLVRNPMKGVKTEGDWKLRAIGRYKLADIFNLANIQLLEVNVLLLVAIPSIINLLLSSAQMRYGLWLPAVPDHVPGDVHPHHLPRLAQVPQHSLCHGHCGLPGTTTEIQHPENRSYMLNVII